MPENHGHPDQKDWTQAAITEAFWADSWPNETEDLRKTLSGMDWDSWRKTFKAWATQKLWDWV